MFDLPPDMLSIILGSLDLTSLSKMSLVCRKWKEISRQDKLWSQYVSSNVVENHWQVFQVTMVPQIEEQRREIKRQNFEVIKI